MYGSWLGTALLGVLALILLVGLSVLASPLIAVILAVLLGGVAVLLFVGRRAAGGTPREPGAAGRSGPAGKSAFRGGPGPSPRDGGAPASGEGHARGGETAGTSQSG